MAAIVQTPDETSRKIAATILQRLAAVGQTQLAQGLGISESTVSRWKSEQIEQCAKALAVLGLKVVPAEMRCFDPKMIGAILELAKERMAAIENPEQLSWND